METHVQTGGGPISAVLFEPYGTLLDIETDERDWYAYLNLARFLEYRGLRLTADELRWLWFEKVSQHLERSGELYPEYRTRAVWRELLLQNIDLAASDRDLDAGSFLADLTMLHRALTRRSLRLMEGVRPLLEALAGRTRLGVVTDCQPEYLLPELRIAGIDRYIEAVAISGARGYRKPDTRLFTEALDVLGVAPEQAIFVGVDTARDVTGARTAGIRSALVLTPYGSKDIALGEPDYVIDHTGELITLLDLLLKP